MSSNVDSKNIHQNQILLQVQRPIVLKRIISELEIDNESLQNYEGYIKILLRNL